MKIIRTVWSNDSEGKVGLVVTESREGFRKIKAGIASGLDKDFDAQKIAKYGGAIAVDDLAQLILECQVGTDHAGEDTET